MSELYRDYIDGKADEIINSLGGTITPAPANAELYRDFLDRKFDDVINAIGNVKVKSFTYTGDGNTTNNITFPTTPKVVLLIVGGETTQEIQSTVPPLAWGVNVAWGMTILSKTNPSGANNVFNMFTSYISNILTITGGTANRCLNTLNREYTVYYI